MLYDDHTSLVACSLTCRAWLNRSRYHLHKSITHNYDEDPRLPPDFYSSCVSDFVIELDLTLLPDPTEAFTIRQNRSRVLTERDKRIEESVRNIWRTILRLTHVRNLTLRRFECWRAKPLQVALFSSAFSQITQLHLIKGFFLSRNHFSSFISLFPDLTQLHISDVHWPDSTTAEDQAIVPWRGRNLRNLTLESFPGFDPHVVRDLAAWISAIPDPSHALRNFQLSFSSGRDGTEQLPEIFRACGSSLKHLVIHLGFDSDFMQTSKQFSHRGSEEFTQIRIVEATNIHLLTELESIRFRALCLPPIIQLTDGDCAYVAHILSQITSGTVLTVEFECASSDVEDLTKRLDFRAIDTSLCRSPFDSLKEIKFIFSPEQSPSRINLDAILQKSLPKTHARSIVNLCFE
ncbi:hypothetical protein NLI96_g4533 [Meripilus lineatus]|uniref:Uncharacterized protein n=1 Tax=Meripilus lineatus TaxID=2056292 RepID=A0AAD5YK11_9APHY|nr:hypothetical protein NLI96_g4533 [Physisporinus lineatus]